MAERPQEVEFAGYKRQIQYDSVEPMNGGFGKGGYDYEVIRVDALEAGIYHIPRGQTTRVVEIVQEVKCGERLVEGSGWFLKIDKHGMIQLKEFDSNGRPPGDVFYGEGDTIVWGAKTDMRAVTFSDRPFAGDMEVNVEIDDPNLPKEFWQIYHQMKSQSV